MRQVSRKDIALDGDGTDDSDEEDEAEAAKGNAPGKKPKDSKSKFA